jgi:hypothetical protein
MVDHGNLDCFIGILDKHEYHFENGVIVLKKIKRSTKFLSIIKKSIYRSNKFITLDLETRLIEDIMRPYCDL